jgi:predicted O-linked N-acetylglucosamine transferase (SPINDLY family)
MLWDHAIEHHLAGRLTEAETLYRQLLARQPASASALHMLGVLRYQLGNGEAGLELIDRAIAILQQVAAQRPGDSSIAEHLAAVHNDYGVMLERQGAAEPAILSFTAALSWKHDFAEAHFNLGNTLAGANRFDEAIAAYRQAISLKPNMPKAHNNLGVALFNRGRLEEAIASYHEALRHRPDDAQAHNNLGSALRIAGQPNEAVAAYRRALDLEPDDAEVWNNLGSALDSRGESEQALEAFQKALESRPAFSEAQNNLGNALKNLGDLDGALAAYRRAIDLQPDNQEAHGNRLYTMYFHADYPAERIYREHRLWNGAHAAKLAPTNPRFENDRTERRRLRVGYIAATFRDHCQSFFTVPLWAHHDHEQVEVIAYSDVAAQDAITETLRGFCDDWRPIAGLPDEAVARQVRRDRVDVLVDLSLHMAHNRLLVLARKPAPVQVTWLGYPGTTGLSTVDYRLTDPYLDPPSGEYDAFHSETSYRLPHTFWCYDPLADDPPVNALPATRSGQFTFGCLNNFCKVNAGTLRLWAAVMTEVPSSKLLLLAPRGARQRVVDTLGRGGIAANRIEFVDRAPRARYLAYYQRIDLGLDTIPYNGHTTTLDSLWMGVPVITLIGNSPAGRAGWSQLNNLGLQRQYAAAAEEDFARLAAASCGNLNELSGLRATLRDRLAHSPLCDAAAFARDLESAYRTMWQRHLTAAQ